MIAADAQIFINQVAKFCFHLCICGKKINCDAMYSTQLIFKQLPGSSLPMTFLPSDSGLTTESRLTDYSASSHFSFIAGTECYLELTIMLDKTPRVSKTLGVYCCICVLSLRSCLEIKMIAADAQIFIN
jgi:hypothetical protein